MNQELILELLQIVFDAIAINRFIGCGVPGECLSLTERDSHLSATSRELIDGSIGRCVVLSAAATAACLPAALVFNSGKSSFPFWRTS